MIDTLPEEAAIQIKAASKTPGGPWFVTLTAISGQVRLGPYENPAIAREDADKLRRFLAAAITHGKVQSDGT